MPQSQRLPAPIPQESLIKMAGLASFNKGIELAKHLEFSNLQISEHKVSGQVDSRTVALHYHDKHIQGECDCPVSDGFDFCEHCVCLALYVNKQIQQIRSLAKGPDKSKVLAYLLSLDKQELAIQCLKLITEDTNQFERYLLKSFLHHAEIDYSQLKTQVTQLTRKPENLFSQRQVKVFFNKLERFLAELNAEDAPEFDIEKILKVLEYTFQRLNLLLEQIEDSNEQRAACIAHLNSLYLNTLSKQTCREDTQAKRFFGFWLEDRYDLLDQELIKSLKPKIQEKFKTFALELWQTHQKSQLEKSLKDWQMVKLARYLFEDAIQSHDELAANEYRSFFSKD